MNPPSPAAPRALALQGGLLALVIGAGWLAAHIAGANLARAGIGIDFGFFSQRAGFDIGDTLISYSASDTYARAFFVGLINTLVLAAASMVSATVVGIAAGSLLVSDNPLAEGAMRAYVGAMRNLPKLVLLLAIYVVMVSGLPNVRAALNPLPGVFVSNRGLHLPGLDWSATASLMPAWSVPVLEGFDFSGGMLVPLAFVALWVTLTGYHGAQIAEIVRGGINSVPKGQWDAALALGLTPWQRMTSVILPQVARSILPPMTSQYLNLIKNTSIGLAVGYTELLAVGGTTINQSLRSVEVMTVVMSVYLAISLVVAAGMNLLNARLRVGVE